MTDLELRELRFFHAVAEELNFSRAAERLGMAQPPLSRAIRQLERRPGVELFERSNRHVALTDAGLALMPEAERVFAAVAVAVARTRQAGMPDQLTITAKPAVATDLLREIVTAFRDLPGAPLVQVVVSGYGQQEAMLRDGRADLALLGSPHEEEGLELEPLISGPRVAALPIGHELAGRPGL
ncbi:LysR family transcriptional regulator [Tenggerimyces flavus]|uniref:LysR family transcriptional regulator n=1 Tax=Tenggerimyces flavus TaxID=1708749 RepID=A0ABV7YPD9_9ACTN|nr:LysR family transcriptional regulator [Tenggerimyces flavus]MBM7790195.1 DNA-binding transcriptional LysR family regulator [Tenggerimyces flavus]